MRIEKALLVGPIFSASTRRGLTRTRRRYATSLEFDVGYGWLEVNAASAVAAA